MFVAVRDAIARFQIPASLLDELVAGTAMDLDHAMTDAPDTYATFDDLYRYCYLVASVVGLVCIRIFGYSDPRAEKLAEYRASHRRPVSADFYRSVFTRDHSGAAEPMLGEVADAVAATEQALATRFPGW